MKIPNVLIDFDTLVISLARIVSEDSQRLCYVPGMLFKSSKDS